MPTQISSQPHRLFGKANYNDFAAVGDYLGFPRKEWIPGHHRNDVLCRHCRENGPVGFIQVRDGDIAAYVRLHHLETREYRAQVRKYGQLSEWIALGAKNCHTLYGRCPWCPNPESCGCSEWKDGRYYSNLAYYDARFLSIREAAARIGVSRSTLYGWRKAGKLNAGNGLVGRALIDSERFHATL